METLRRRSRRISDSNSLRPSSLTLPLPPSENTTSGRTGKNGDLPVVSVRQNLEQGIKTVFDILNQRQIQGGSADRQKLSHAFVRVFDKDGTQKKKTDKGIKAISYPISELLNRFITLAEKGFTFSLTKITARRTYRGVSKGRPHHSLLAFPCHVTIERVDKMADAIYTFFVQRDNYLVVYTERNSVKWQEKRQLSSKSRIVDEAKVLSTRNLPIQLNGELLGQGSKYLGATEIQAVAGGVHSDFKIRMKQERNMNGQERVKIYGHSCRWEGIYFTKHTNAKGGQKMPNYLLRDELDEVIACCVGDQDVSRTAYVIGGRYPLYPKDKKSTEVKANERRGICAKYHFYPWLRVRQAGLLPFRPVDVWNGSTFVPFLKAVPIHSSLMKALKTLPQSNLEDEGDKDDDNDEFCDGIICKAHVIGFDITDFGDKGKVMAKLRLDDEVRALYTLNNNVTRSGFTHELSVKRGVDKAMILCISIILASTTEFMWIEGKGH